MLNKTKKEPKFHVVKRTNTDIATMFSGLRDKSLPKEIKKAMVYDVVRSIMLKVIAIVLAIILCSILTIAVTGKNPISVMSMFVSGAFGATRIWGTLQEIAILLAVSLALTPAFRMHFWNTGAEGQVLAGCLATAMTMWLLGGKIPEIALIIIMFISAVAAGVIWGVIPAIFKANWGTNETLFTLMMNYVAIQAVQLFLKIADKSGSNTVGPSILKNGWFRLPEVWFEGSSDALKQGSSYFLNIIFVIILTVILTIYLNKSKHGYEISVVGESVNTARYIGINVKGVIIRTMAVSGGICGFVGWLLVGGTSHSIDPNLVGGKGFTGILVAWLAKFNPIIMILTTILICFFSRGASSVATFVGINESFSDVITAIVIFFIIGCEFFANYKIVRTHQVVKASAAAIPARIDKPDDEPSPETPEKKEE